MPRVTVCIPIYNRSQRLRPTVESVLAQTFSDWELLLIDDGSTDDTAEVAREYASDPRVQYIHQANGGHSAARNHGLRRAEGEFLAYLDHDDRWVPEKLQAQVSYLDTHPERVLVYGRFRLIDEEGADRGVEEWCEAEGDVTRELLWEGNFLRSMSLPLMRTDAVRAVGGFHARRDIVDDLDLFLRLSASGLFGFLPQVLLQYNTGSELQQTRDLFRGHRSHWQLIRDYSHGRDDGPVLRAHWVERYSAGFRELGWQALRRGEYPAARSLYMRAARLQPRLLLDRNFTLDLLSSWKRGRAAGPAAGATS